MEEVVLRLLKTYGVLSFRYLLFAGSLYLIFYVWKKRELFKLKIQQKYPNHPHILREIKYSFLSLLVFTLVGYGIYWLRMHGYTKIYTRFSDHSVGYFIFSVAAFIFMHDLYFYITHRIMHWKVIYPYVHKVHHLSTNPTPWAAFAFHPIEALIEVGILPLMVFLIPLHPLAILSWVLFQTGMNVLGHLGFELFPSGFTTGPISRWSNTSVHHNMHHKCVQCNYGLYFNIWDRIFGTNHPEYTAEFERVKQRAKHHEQSVPELDTAEAVSGI
ncbi:MAG: sterol desaturase family protein [Chitinophagales bacterium]|nr:sterol desaturase family protein [Chitinophagales bacterium]MDW8417983.1 sterol desaturase family protein [Chitinophagales bacterium]